jgi:DNA polymerase III delta subunit
MLHSTLSPKSDAEVAKLLNVREYAIKKARQIKNLNKIKMKSILDMLVDYEYKFKSGSMSLDLAFDCAISNIMQI